MTKERVFQSPKKVYSTPDLSEWGTIYSITHGAANPPGDAPTGSAPEFAPPTRDFFDREG